MGRDGGFAGRKRERKGMCEGLGRWRERLYVERIQMW